MSRLLSHCSTSNFLRYRPCSSNRSKYDFVISVNSKVQFSISNIKRGINKSLLNKIWDTKDQKIKPKIIRTITKINSDYKRNSSTFDCLTRSQMKNNETKMKEVIKTNCKIALLTSPNKSETIKDKRQEKIATKTSDVHRPIRREPGEVICGFIPKEWLTFFVPITGYSGFYTLLVTLGTSLFSKEIYVCDHDYYNGISLVLLCIYVVKTQGPIVAKMLDKEIDNYERELNNWKEQMKRDLRDSILSEIKYQECIEGQQILVDAKRENVHLQREAEFRKRQMEVYENVTRILNYHVEHEKVRRSIQHKNLIQWVTKEVEKNLTPELKEKYMKLCLADIKEIFRKNEK